MRSQLSKASATERGEYHSYPTRRSSDLAAHRRSGSTRRRRPPRRRTPGTRARAGAAAAGPARSVEQTSGLQSHVNLVCRLLLEKKKKSVNAFAAEQSERDRESRIRRGNG